ncbi:hypothetical protein ABEB36_010542 [Hypothenemus hampei]|uniref:UDENN domain-containing protein n=1 Tax=Hypothenemus hampei TaxID=57062 RepID=A0ABD1EK38_HYPHA
MVNNEGPILYVLVIGFHHKKGCQVEYSFPALVPGAPNECPSGWKYLPTLALPDGSHNYEDDTVFFHLPSLTNSKETVFGISCFRQIPVEKLKNRTSDITRTTVQKSVCVLSKIPLYGQIQVKMTLITHAYFDEGDFSKVSILEDTFHHLNAVMSQADIKQQTFVGLSTRDLILHWKHKAVLLFKLLLLEKRVIFYKSPVLPLCTTILTLVSLFPEMIEKGLQQSACIRLSRPMSPMPQFSDDDSPTNSPNKQNGIQTNKKSEENEKLDHIENGIEITETFIKHDTLGLNEKSNSLRREVSVDTITDSLQNNLCYLAQINTETLGFPLMIFTKGSLCLPYLSLPYLDLLSDVNVRSYVVGATNVLFKQKKQLYDILVDIDGTRIECSDVALRKSLHLTTEDLRFADYIVKHVSEERHDVFLDGVGYEGGDEWIRTQFKVYLLCLLRTSLLPDGSREAEHFNANFVAAWKETHNYKLWASGNYSEIIEIHSGHPFAGQLSVADMKLRLSHTMQTTEGGRKLGQAMTSTGRAVATTSRAVGGAISQAKGAFSSWWNNFLISPEPGMVKENGKEESGSSVLDINDAKLNDKKPQSSLVYIPNSIKANDNDQNTPENFDEHDINNRDASQEEHQPGQVHTV